MRGYLLSLLIAVPLMIAGGLSGAAQTPSSGCSIERAVRAYSHIGASAQWGDEVDVRVTVAITCTATTATALDITEMLSPEAPWVPGFGTSPSDASPQRLSWHFANPAIVPATIELNYRVYATPERSRLSGENAVPVSWPMNVALTVDGATESKDLMPPPLAVRSRDSATCALARAREVAPESVLAGAPFTVTLRLTVNRCPAYAARTRLLLALQPPASAEESTRMGLAVSAMLGTLAPENAAVGLVMNRAGGPVVVPPTGDYALVADAVRNEPVGATSGADARQALSTALPLLPGWAFHHSIILLVATPGAPSSDVAALQQQLDAAKSAGVEVATVCVGGGCDPGLVVHHAVADWATLRRQFTGGLLDAHRGPPLVLQGLDVEDRFLRFVKVDATAAQPPADVVGGNTLAWHGLAVRPGQVVRLSYPARVDIWGRLPIAAGGVAWLRYADGLRQRFELPQGSIHVQRDPAAETRPCQPEVAKEALPSRLPLGETVEVKLAFGAVCPGEVSPVDVVLVQDVSGSMDGAPLADAKAALLGFLNTVDSGAIRVGLVAFDGAIQARVPLTDDLDTVRKAVNGLAAMGGTDIARGLDEAGRLLASRRPDATPVVVLMTDGYNNAGSEPMVGAALDLRTNGILVAAVCFGGQCDARLPDVATDLDFFYQVLGGNDLLLLFAELGAQLRQSRLTSAHLVDTLPPHMRFVPGSAVPAPVSVNGDTLVWDIVDPPPGGVNIRYRAEPLLLGRQVTNVSAHVAYVDDKGRHGEADFPIPAVETFIPDPNGPCNPALGKVADRTQLLLGEDAGLRLTMNMACPGRQAALDVVLVLDHSASMGFLGRLDNVKTATRAFLDKLDPAVTRVGLVTFGTDVTGKTALTSDYQPIRAKVAALRADGETGIGQALNAASDLLAVRRPDALSVVVLLTDGANTAGPGPMLAAAGRLKDGGARVVTVCAGACDVELAAVASDPAYNFQVTDSAALVALFTNLAADLSGSRPHDLVVTDAFPSAVEVVAGSLNPAPAAFAGGQAMWRFAALPSGGVTLTYRVRPLVAGLVPANRFARVDYRYGLDGAGWAYFPVPVLDVVDEHGPTRTPTPVLTPVPTAGTETPTGTPTTRATPSATIIPGEGISVYLPWCGQWRPVP